MFRLDGTAWYFTPLTTDCKIQCVLNTQHLGCGGGQFCKGTNSGVTAWGVGAGEAAHLVCRLKFDLVLGKGTLKKRLDRPLRGLSATGDEDAQAACEEADGPKEPRSLASSQHRLAGPSQPFRRRLALTLIWNAVVSYGTVA